MSKSSPIQPKLLSKINERLVMRIIQDNGPSTRGEISKIIGVTFPTVAKAVSSLLESKLLEEVEEMIPGPGRPARQLRLASEYSQVIAVSLSGSECTVACAGLDGIIYAENTLSFPTPTTYDSLLINITSHIKKLTPQNNKTALCVGVSIPGIVDYTEQRVILSANLSLLDGKQIGRDLQDLLGVECLIVRDSHALSLSEQLHGQGEDVSHFAMLDLCGGVGLGLMVDGKFLTGGSGFAGELGHMIVEPGGELCRCGKRGCLETVASEWALEAKVSRLMRRTIKVDEILELAQSGDKQVQLELEKMCDSLAFGVASVVNIINPLTFYIYGRVFRARPQLLALLVDKTEQYALEPSFSACTFAHARGGVLDGIVSSMINYLTDSLVPDLDAYVNFAGVGQS